MRYTERTSAKKLRENYDLLVGWGGGVLEFESRYNPSMYRLDYLINGRGSNIGGQSCGYVIQDTSVIDSIKETKMNILLDHGAYCPKRSTRNPNSYEVRTPVYIRLEPGASFVLDTRIHIEPDPDSSYHFKNKRNLIQAGIQARFLNDLSDSKSLMIELINDSSDWFRIRKGEGVARIVFEQN